MPSIQSLHAPLAYKVEDRAPQVPENADALAIVVKARSLEGMQKEAIVENVRTGAVWRMTCDEGPYLNGTDLAPFPLAFFTAGAAISITSNVRALTDGDGDSLTGLEVTLDSFYTMEGSAVRGTMTGGARPAELHVTANGVDEARLGEIANAAARWALASVFLRQALPSEFSLVCNGQPVPPGSVKPAKHADWKAPGPVFESLSPPSSSVNGTALLSKLESAEQLFGVDGGAGSSLQADQKRVLHVRGVAKVTEDGLYDIKIQLFKPIGSVFRFIGDDGSDRGGRDRAPTGPDYTCAGIAFCFMTQLGRYAQIVKQDLRRYEVVQVARFDAEAASLSGEGATAEPIVTHVFIETGEDLEKAQTLLKMGEQTCFLHGALRESHPVNVKVEAE